MDYFSKTFNYIFSHGKGKRFLVFALFAALPAAGLAYYFPASNLIHYLFNYRDFPHASWGELWLNLFPVKPLGFLFIFLAFVLFVFFFSAITTIVTRHLRIGKFSVPKLSALFNENFFPALHFSFFVAVTLVIIHTFCTFFLYLWTFTYLWLTITLSVFTIVVFVTLATYLYAAVTLWLPIMSLNGSSWLKSLQTAFIRSRGQTRKFLLSYAILLVIILIFGFAAFFTRHVWYVSWIITTVSYILLVVFTVNYSIISYFEVESITREDLIRSPYLR